MQKFIAKVALLLCLPVLAMAQGVTYIQGELGRINQSIGNKHMFRAGNNPSGPAARVAIGQLFGDTPFKFGFETGFTYYNNSRLSEGSSLYPVTLRYSGYNVDLLAVAKYNFDSGYKIFGKVGEAYLYQRAKTSSDNNIGIETRAQGDKFAPVIALGVGYQATPKVELNFTATSIYAGTPDSPNHINPNPTIAVQTVFLGLNYQLD